MIQVNASLVLNQAQGETAVKRTESEGGHKVIARTLTEEETKAKNQATEKLKVVVENDKVQAMARDEDQAPDERERRGKDKQRPKDIYTFKGLAFDLDV